MTDSNLSNDLFRQEVLAGLRASPKTLPCKYFYDSQGSELFEQICDLPEYYPTRTELGIMEEHAGAMARWLGPGAGVIEYGSGSGRKTRVLLDHLDSPAVYIPIDISRAALLESAEAIAKDYSSLRVVPLCADYLGDLALPRELAEAHKRVVYFPGSTIGNFVPRDAEIFLERMARQVGADGGVLIGVDLKKQSEVLERAYDDSQGVTAAFNKNLLVRINRELGADFPCGDFAHEARWNPSEGRVEMHLVSGSDCTVEVAGEAVAFRAGESIHTENSYKYDLGEFEGLASGAGLVLRECWTDPSARFSVQYFEVAKGAR